MSSEEEKNSGEARREHALDEVVYRTLLDSIDEGFYLIDVIFDANDKPVDMFFVTSNLAANRMVGSDYTGRRLREIAPCEEYWYEIFGHVARTSESVRMERYAEPDKKWWSFYAFKVEGGEGRRIGNLFKDITDRKRAEEALREANEHLEVRVEERTRELRESEKRFQTMADGSPSLIWVSDTKGRLLFSNRASKSFFGRDLKGTKDREWLEFLHPDDAKEYYGKFLHALRTHDPFVSEARNRRADGTWRWLEAHVVPRFSDDGTFLGFVGTSVDITERRRAEDALRKSLTVLSKSQEIAHLGSWSLDFDTGWFEASDEDYRIYGLEPKSPTFLDQVWKLIHPDDVERYRAYVASVQLEGHIGGMDYRIIRPDGSLHYVHAITDSVVRGPDGKVKAASGTTQDITERKRMEDELRRSNAELQQFAYVASHDLQEPLRMVTSYLGLLEKRCGDELDSKASEYMAFAVDGSMRMKELIDDLLQYSSIDSRPIGLESVDMNEVVKITMDDLKTTVDEAGAEVLIDRLPTVCADRIQIKQLLTNLISNAIKFHGDRRPRVEISAVTYGTDFVFSVKDNGIGIDPKYSDKMFKMFSRMHTRQEYPGTGIGLAIAKKIVERHGGRIWFESEPGKGTTFFFTIPD